MVVAVYADPRRMGVYLVRTTLTEWSLIVQQTEFPVVVLSQRGDLQTSVFRCADSLNRDRIVTIVCKNDSVVLLSGSLFKKTLAKVDVVPESVRAIQKTCRRRIVWGKRILDDFYSVDVTMPPRELRLVRWSATHDTTETVLGRKEISGSDVRKYISFQTALFDVKIYVDPATGDVHGPAFHEKIPSHVDKQFGITGAASLLATFFTS